MVEVFVDERVSAISLDDVDMPDRVRAVLKAADVHNLYDAAVVVSMRQSEILRQKGVGRGMLGVIRKTLEPILEREMSSE